MVVEYNGKKIAFVHIGGNAGTSIEWYLFTINKGIQYPNLQTRKKGEAVLLDTIRDKGFKAWLSNQHETYQQMYNRIGDAVYFSVVRNPYKRILAKFFTSSASKNAIESNVVELFDDFVDRMLLKKEYSKKERIHFTPQLDLIRCEDKEVEYIIRFENLQREFRMFCKKNRLPIRKLIKCNSTTHPLKSTDIYTGKAKEIVYNHERELIERYGYHI